MPEELVRYLRFKTGGVTIDRKEPRVEGHVAITPREEKGPEAKMLELIRKLEPKR